MVTGGMHPPPPPLCVSCLVRVGRERASSVLKSVVCGPCWAAHGGRPAAGEIGPAPTETIPVGYPGGQSEWLRELGAQGWVQAIRGDGHRNLMTIARTVMVWTVWETLESRPTWAELMTSSGLSARSVARWLLELRLHGWLELLERGSTPQTRPMALAHLEGNRAAVYGLRLPLTPERALAVAGELLVTELATALEELPAGPAAGREGGEPAGPVDVNGTPSWSFRSLKERSKGGFSRASELVDNSGRNCPDREKGRMTALRAGSEEEVPDLLIMVPVSGYEMLACADDLRRRHLLAGRCSRRLVRQLCRPLWRAGWCNRDVLHALDYRPSMFGQPCRPLVAPDHVVSPAQFIRSRFGAWRGPDGTIRPGYWTSRADTAAGRARELVRSRHGRAGVRLLRAGEQALSAERIAEHGRAARTPTPNARPAAGTSGAGQSRVADRDGRRAELVARARAEQARTVGQSGTPTQEWTGHSDASGTAYDRALTRARAEARSAPDRRRRR